MTSVTTSTSGRRNLAILQIENGRADAELALIELSMAGFEVIGDVVDSLSEVASHMSAKSYDVVLSAYHLPGWLGTDALQIVRQHQPDLPFILVTGTLGDDNAAECLKQGVTDIVLKDRLARLPFVIQRAIEEKGLREEREIARRALAESEARFRSVVEASPDAIFVSCEGGLVFANPATLKLLGAETSGQIIGKNASDIVSHDYLPAVIRQIETDYQLKAASPPLECVFMRLDGTPVQVECVGIHISWHGDPAIEVVARDITARKEAAKQIAHLASFPEFNPASVFETDLEGKLAYINPAAVRRFPTLLQSGLTHALLKDWLSFIEIFKKDTEHQVTREIEIDGSTYLQTIYLTSEMEMVRAYLVDITDRKQAEEQRRTSDNVILEWKQRLHLAESAALPIRLWEWDLSGDIVKWSQEDRSEFGYTDTVFQGSEDFFGRIHPEDRLRVEAAVRSVESGSSQKYEEQFRLIRPDRTTCWLDSRGVMAPDGSPRMIGIAIDITKLRRSEADYRSIIETAPIGIFRAAGGRFSMANPALVAMLGYDNETELCSLDIARDVYCELRERDRLEALLVEAGYLKEVEVDWKRKDGQAVTVRMNAVVLHNESGTIEGFQGYINDISDRKILARQLWQSQKMEAVGRLAGGVAHDFNNVLMIVGSYADLIKQRGVHDDQVNHYADQIQQSTKRAVSITRQLLAFSRQQILEPEVLNLNTVVIELGKVLPRLLGEDIEVVTTLEPELHRLKVDRGQMEQVLMNLAVNSRDAMPKGGRFEIKTENVALDASHAASHSPMNPGDYIKLTISDTGTGMSTETQLQAFEPFFTTKERGKGTGLGLATVYGIVKQSSGFIWLSSKVGQGTTFEIYFLPVAEEATKPAESRPRAAASNGSETILLVEDEALLRDAICEFLKSVGYNVLVASGGVEARHICERHTGKIDLILTDLVMPGADGVEVANAVSLNYPGIAIVYMTGYTDRAAELLDAGAVMLKKPFSLSELASKLRAALSDAA